MKKGFSLIELLVSLVIISVTMIFISAFVLNLKDEENNNSLNIPTLIDQAAISKTLNNDANKLEISSMTINSNNLNITYKSKTNNINDTGVIEISNDKKTIKYYKNGDLVLVRTLKTGTYESITKSVEEIGNSKKLYKYIINISTGENIEVYYYGV